jgi:hypothetical protein
LKGALLIVLAPIEIRILLILALVILAVFIVWLLLRKHVVTVPSITLAITPVTPPGQYDHGATVNVTGTDLLDTGPPALPAVGDTINLEVKDSAGTEFSVGSVQAASDGTYKASFVVPATAAPGTATLTATDATTGATATATFRLNNTRIRSAEIGKARSGAVV